MNEPVEAIERYFGAVRSLRMALLVTAAREVPVATWRRHGGAWDATAGAAHVSRALRSFATGLGRLGFAGDGGRVTLEVDDAVALVVPVSPEVTAIFVFSGDTPLGLVRLHVDRLCAQVRPHLARALARSVEEAQTESTDAPAPAQPTPQPAEPTPGPAQPTPVEPPPAQPNPADPPPAEPPPVAPAPAGLFAAEPPAPAEPVPVEPPPAEPALAEPTSAPAAPPPAEPPAAQPTVEPTVEPAAESPPAVPAEVSATGPSTDPMRPDRVPQTSRYASEPPEGEGTRGAPSIRSSDRPPRSRTDVPMAPSRGEEPAPRSRTDVPMAPAAGSTPVTRTTESGAEPVEEEQVSVPPPPSMPTGTDPPPALNDEPLDKTRGERLLEHLEQYAPDAHAALLRVSLQTGLPMALLRTPERMSDDEIEQVEASVKRILGSEELSY